MAQRLADSAAVSVFCDSVALMLSVGIQTDEAVHMLSEDMGDTSFGKTCNKIYRSLIAGKSLAQSMKDTGAFPRYATDMVEVGERSGHLEDVLRSLSVYYNEESRLFAKISSSIGYPTALLCIMSAILLFAVLIILPVFIGVYERLSGSLTAGSFSEVSVAIGIGWVALIVTLVFALVFLVASPHVPFARWQTVAHESVRETTSYEECYVRARALSFRISACDLHRIRPQY